MKHLIVLLSIGWLLGTHSLLLAADTFGNSGIVAWWTFDAQDTDWNANTTSDVSGKGNMGTMTNMPPASSITGKVGEAFLFNGNNTAVGLASNPLANMSSPSSACAWAYTTDIAVQGSGAWDQTLLNFYTDNDNCIRMLSIPGSGQLCASYRAGGTYYGVQSDAQVFVNNSWTHVCYVWDGSGVTLYVNGSLVSTSTGNYTSGQNNVIGARDDDSQGVDGCWSGGLDEILVFNRALSANEVQAIYNAGGGGLVAASTVQTSLPTYGSCPAPEPGKGLIIITHGWIPLWDDRTDDTAWVDQMSGSISQYLANNGLENNWQVYGYKWADGGPYGVNGQSGAYQRSPTAALGNAEQQGKKLGDSIVALGGWTHFHFIAHSAGAGLIQKAAEQIRASLKSGVTIHCTFLDAYDGVVGEKALEYGTKADWADSYFVRDEVQLLGWTGRILPNAYNVDVTALDSKATPQQVSVFSSSGPSDCTELQSSHGWPIDFYANTIAGNSSVYGWSGYNGFGWPLSEECGNWSFANSQYPVGNGVSFGSVTQLGPENGTCIPPYTLPPGYIGTVPTFAASSTIQSDTGTLQIFPGSFKPQTDSPVWIATVITDTNALNYVSFDAEFTSAAGADGLLSVYWDTNMIGLLDEAAVQPGFQHYNLSFPNAAPNTSHVLGFHLDPFSTVQSSMILTNIVTGCVGVSQPFSLSITANTSNGLLVYQLTGQPANYTVQASTDLLNWRNIAILANTTGTVSFTDPNSTNRACCFYRVVTQ